MFCLCQLLGYRNPNNGRVRNIEAQIRKGAAGVPLRKKRELLVNTTSLARAFMREYIFKHKQDSPSVTTIYVDHIGNRELYKLYVKEATEKGYKYLEPPSFVEAWRQLLDDGVDDPETSVHSKVEIRKRSAKGFADCNRCSYLMMKIRGTSDVAARQVYTRKYNKHIREVYDDREELARIQRLCIVDNRHCGFFMDAADSNKFSIPTTTSCAKMLSQLWRVKQKLTCVQMFNARKTLYFFRTLPDVPTGANLTCTILADMFSKKDLFGNCTDVYINVDGSGDNINYTVVYTLVHFLLNAHAKKMRLTRIHILRMQVGHTHNDLDAAFALLSRLVYGKHSRGDPRLDVFSFDNFVQVHFMYDCKTHTRARTHT